MESWEEGGGKKRSVLCWYLDEWKGRKEERGEEVDGEERERMHSFVFPFQSLSLLLLVLSFWEGNPKIMDVVVVFSEFQK